MQHIHAREWLDAGNRVRVDCDHQCNVLVMDDHNYSLYRRGQSFRHFGGFFKRLPAVVSVPNGGNWNTVIDLGGGRANIRYAINYLN
ncbi:DUF1883 domain-containing protein [Sphingopyxis lindanitolerans]|uniref:DUF1883 domain-containing protein n=1 Tax=Sphingopyxis lindanitolerans TaxID=2054227 RepID=A0A2S8B1V2_9SPHN|nr:DUF1883 domain-containing protein [Sphingopyxis lindanitolerans]PQM26381.1 DUF1883 domain-containing protein [Sphingopyxis lindanitolerans]